MRNSLRSSFLILACSAALSLYSCNRVDNVTAPNFVCPSSRFITEQFTSITATIAYGTAVDYQGKTITLQADITQPTSDTLAHRPLIIYCHGGGFTSGARNNAWSNKFCQSFARRGYIAASIDYRMGLASASDADVISAQIRAMQDAKAAIRYFKQTAIEMGNPYRIDTAQIYIAGESTGAMIALQAAYLKSAADFAEIADPALLSSLNGIEGNTSLPYSSGIAGVIGLSGALLDLNWFKNSNTPAIMVHSSTDAVIPYKMGIAAPYASIHAYGSFSIDSAAISTKVVSSLHTFKNAGNAPYLTSTTYADSTVNYVAQQLYKLIDCQRLGHR